MGVLYRKKLGRKPGPHWQEGRRIAALRGRMGLTQQQFAFMLSTSSLTVWKWEIGDARPEAASAALINALDGRVGQVKPEPSFGEIVGKVAVGAVAGVALLAVLQALFGGKK